MRAVIDAVRPCVDGGRFAVKRVEGEIVTVEADCFTDGHDALRVLLRWRAAEHSTWQDVEMVHDVNDLWRGSFVAGPPGRRITSYNVCYTKLLRAASARTARTRRTCTRA